MAIKSTDKNKSSKSNSPSLSGPTSEYLEVKRPQVPENLTIDNFDLPSHYNKTQLTLIARDPFWIHAYWEIAAQSMDDIRKRIGDELNHSRIVLRMYDVTLVDFNDNNANHWFDIEVGSNTSWYVNLWSDGVSYCADLGVKTPDGRFFAMTRSNFVTTPRVNMASRSDLIWMEVNEQKQTQPFVYIDKHSPKGKHPLAAKKDARPMSLRQRKRLFLSENDIRNYYSKLFPLLKLLKKARGITELGDRLLESDMDARDPATRFEHARLARIEEELRRRNWRNVGASEELAGEQQTPSPESSFTNAQTSEQHLLGPRKFFFEIGAELIVYGRTEPDASVWLGDKNIKLREDGTFTLRYALPDGKIPFDFLAQSFDKVDERRISTSVERTKTIYSP